MASMFKMALGCIPTMLLMTNSKRAKPTPSFGICAKLNAISGLPTFIMILQGGVGKALFAWLETSKVSAP
jgi:hypothetical protein